MIEPKSIVVQTSRYWPFVVALMELSQQHSSFDHAHLLRIAGRELPGLKSEERRSTVARMIQSGLLQGFEGGYELHFPTLTYLEALHKEQPLGHVGVIEGHVKALRDANDELAAGIDSDDFAGRIARANKLLMRQSRLIHDQVEADFQAILGLIEHTKSSDADIPRSDRYDLVLDAHDNYLQPMIELISVDGPFGSYLSVAIERLVEASGRARRANVAGGLERQLEGTAARLRSLPAQIRTRMGRAAQLLRPIVDQARKHNEFARRAAIILAAVRKRGANDVLSAEALPSFIRTRQYTLRLGLAMEAVMAKARSREVAPRRFPNLTARPQSPGLVSVVRMDQILKALRKESEPVADLLGWIHEHHPELGLEMTLGRYLDLIKYLDQQKSAPRAQPTGPIRTLRIDGRRLNYTPHGLTQEQS